MSVVSSSGNSHFVPATVDTVQWGYFWKNLTPVVRINSGDLVTIEVVTHHAGDAPDLMIKGDKNIEDIYNWTKYEKAINRRGAGDINSTNPGAGQGKGVHIITGPIWVNNAEPGDILKVEILDIIPRKCKNPKFKKRYFGSNLAAWWGYQYGHLNTEPKKREVATIYQIFPNKKKSIPIYNYRYVPQTDPFGTIHPIYNYPGVIVNQSTIQKNYNIKHLNIKLRPHFGVIGVTPKDDSLVTSIPPSLFGGNIDNWRAGKCSTVYLPVQVEGAKFIVGDSHACQGDSECCGTALEFSMTGVFKISLIKKKNNPFKGLECPIIETKTEWVIQGLSYPDYLKQLGPNAQDEIYNKSSVDLAMRDAFSKTNTFITNYYNISEDQSISTMSVGVDFGVTQVVDGNWGVHSIIKKSMFEKLK
jgi:acetamidase/formamidase